MTSLTGSLPSSPNELRRTLAQALRAKELRLRRNWLRTYQPYIKQLEFHAAGADHSERLFMAGNQLGKTLAGGAEVAYHLTGLYPDWWPGARFDEPPLIWAGSVTGEATRDNPQRILVGQPAQPAEWGTGTIPGDLIIGSDKAMGVPNLLDNCQVKHVNGTSQVTFKAYEKGREKWQGPTVRLVWFDEEPPLDIYSEGLTRTQAFGICTMITATPLLGITEVIRSFVHDQARHEDDNIRR